MAKNLLWFIVACGMVISIIFALIGETTDLYTKIIILSSVGVLAICESIESLSKRS